MITTKCVGAFESDPGTEESQKMLEEARARNKERKEEWEKLLEKNKEKEAGQEKCFWRLSMVLVTKKEQLQTYFQIF